MLSVIMRPTSSDSQNMSPFIQSFSKKKKKKKPTGTVRVVNVKTTVNDFFLIKVIRTTARAASTARNQELMIAKKRHYSYSDDNGRKQQLLNAISVCEWRRLNVCLHGNKELYSKNASHTIFSSFSLCGLKWQRQTVAASAAFIPLECLMRSRTVASFKC